MSTVIDRIGELLSQLQSPDYYERETAVKELGTYSEDEAVAGLVMAIEDPDLGIREVAADLLTRMNSNVVVQLLISFLAHEDIGTRNLASEILMKIGPDAVLPLIDNLDNDDHDVRKFICDILGLIRDERALDAISQSLTDRNVNVVCSAVEALGEIGSAEAVPALLAIFDKVEDAQLPAVEALGKIADPRALPDLYHYMEMDDPMIVYTSLEAVGCIGNVDSVEKLAKFLKLEDRFIAEAAMMAIIRINEKSNGKLQYDLPLNDFQEFLFEGVRNRNGEVTRFTIDRLNHWYGNDVLKGLLDVIDYVDEETFAEVSEVLVKVGPSVGQLIIEKLPTATLDLKLKLLDVLKHFIDPEMAKPLLAMTSNPEAEVRQRVAHVLGVSGYTGAIDVLSELTNDPVGHVRATAYSAMGWLATEEDAPLLMLGLEDRYPDVREAAMGALIIVGGVSVVKKFTEDLDHDDTERQRLAVTALGWIGEIDVVEPL
ncbi:MAG: HEAT repeat domain-containing protein, partial [candidate division Zixibacteria bacterium]